MKSQTFLGNRKMTKLCRTPMLQFINTGLQHRNLIFKLSEREILGRYRGSLFGKSQLCQKSCFPAGGSELCYRNLRFVSRLNKYFSSHGFSVFCKRKDNRNHMVATHYLDTAVTTGTRKYLDIFSNGCLYSRCRPSNWGFR